MNINLKEIANDKKGKIKEVQVEIKGLKKQIAAIEKEKAKAAAAAAAEE